MQYQQMSTNKNALRKKYRSLRNEISAEELEDKSLAIANNLSKLPIWGNQYFHVFLPILSLREVNTENILHLLAGKDKEVVISKSDFDTRKMTHFLLTDSTKIKVNSYGIPEPVNGLEVPSNKIDVVIVPLLAYDKKGNRVGYGKGFYDAFLASCRADVTKIGVSFFEPEQQFDGLLETDVALDYCVTPDTVYEFS